MMRMETSHSAIELQVHEIEKEPGGGLEPLQPSLASTRLRMGHPPIVRMIPEILPRNEVERSSSESKSDIIPLYYRAFKLLSKE